MIQPNQLRAARPALLVLAAALLTPVSAQAAPQSGKVAIKAGKVHTTPGEPAIENGVVVIEDGRITAVGDSETKIPWDAEVIEMPSGVAFPGFVEAHSFRGTDRPNENIDVVPFLTIADSIDPVNFYFEDSLRWGVTTINVQQGNNTVIGGQGLVVKPVGMTVEEMLVKGDIGLKISASPKSGKSSATQVQALRAAFGDLRRYLEGLVQQKKDGDDTARREALFQGRDLEGENAKGRAMEGTAWKVEGLERVPRGEVDEKQEPLLALVEGKMGAFIACRAAMDVPHALDVARDNGFLAHTTLVLSGDSWKAADRVGEAGVPVVWAGPQIYTERDPLTGEETRTFVPAVLDQHKIRFALSSEDPTNQSLWFQAAVAVGHGLAREKALAAVTSTPAEILGLGKRVGTLEEGKDGNVLLLSGDPLSINSWVEHVIVEGEHVYDRSKDIRIQHLLEGITPPGTAAMGDDQDAPNPHEHDDHGPEEDDDLPDDVKRNQEGDDKGDDKGDDAEEGK